jgi:hypothetical protein
LRRSGENGNLQWPQCGTFEGNGSTEAELRACALAANAGISPRSFHAKTDGVKKSPISETNSDAEH